MAFQNYTFRIILYFIFFIVLSHTFFYFHFLAPLVLPTLLVKLTSQRISKMTPGEERNLESLRALLGHPQASCTDRRLVHTFLSGFGRRVPRTFIPTPHEIDTKLALIRPIFATYTADSNRKDDENRHFLFWHLSSLYFLPDSQLESMQSDVSTINEYLDHCIPFIKQCRPFRYRGWCRANQI